MEKYPRRVDFHVHYDPANEQTAYDAIKIAKERNVVAMAILARSQVSDNYYKFMEYGKEIGVDIVPGVEFLARCDNESADLIILGFDPRNKELKEYFGKDGKEDNRKLAKYQKDFMEKKGYRYIGLDSEQQLLLNKLTSGELAEKAFNFCFIAASLPQNSELIKQLKADNLETWSAVKNKYGSMLNYADNPKKLDAKFMYLSYFDVGKEGYIEVRTKSKTIIDVVHGAGGVVLYSPEGKFRENIWKQLQNDGIDGIMGWHGGALGANGSNSPDIPRKVINECAKNGLLILGGSDYQQLDWQLGTGNGNLYMHPRRYDGLISYIKDKNHGKIPWEINS